MVNWQYFPKSDAAPKHLAEVIDIFRQNSDLIDSAQHTLSSNAVLLILKDGLSGLGFTVEKGHETVDKIKVPVLFGKDGKLEKYFHVDASNTHNETVIEVEAGRAVENYQFLKDLFEACMMHNISYLVIAVRKTYRKKPDFERVTTYFETLYASGRLKLPLKGILIIGY